MLKKLAASEDSDTCSELLPASAVYPALVCEDLAVLSVESCCSSLLMLRMKRLAFVVVVGLAYWPQYLCNQ